MPVLAHAGGTTSKGITVTPNVWLRKTARTRGFALLAVGNAVAWVVMFFLIRNPHWNRTTGEYLENGTFFFGVAALSLMYARRLARAGLWIARDAVTIRGPLVTRTISPADAQSFIPGVQRSGGNGTPCPMLKRNSGRPIGIWALGREGVIFNYRQYQEDLEPLCDQLNELLRSAQAERSR
jgi:hypothetical protein